MKKALIISIAALLMAAPVAQAESRSDHSKRQAYSQFQGDYKKQTQTRNKKSAQHRVAARKHWSKGQRMSDWKKHSAVKDYKRHGLRKPGRGQSWVKVDNQFVLISAISGLIAGIVAAR
ncbi:MAG: RcnB family protein [Hoeflea sp.]|uniref:RcnB family protein n=1 Tax=Hoeflea sp. TaxID=1940281 RepID=UPI003EF68924